MLRKTLRSFIKRSNSIMEMMSPGNVFCPDSSFCCRLAKSQQRVAEPGLHKVPAQRNGQAQGGAQRKEGLKQMSSFQSPGMAENEDRRGKINKTLSL